MQTTIETFETSWRFARQLTHDFIAIVPDERWEFSPHPRYAAFNKQVRHLVCVQGVYTQGLRARATDFGRKHSHYDGPLDREALVAALHAKDEDLSRALREIEQIGEEDYVIEFYGKQTLASYLIAVTTHEAIHHGEWSFYATLGGFETPDSWKLNWGL